MNESPGAADSRKGAVCSPLSLLGVHALWWRGQPRNVAPILFQGPPACPPVRAQAAPRLFNARQEARVMFETVVYPRPTHRVGRDTDTTKTSHRTRVSSARHEPAIQSVARIDLWVSLYFFLMRIDCNPHRFLIIPTLFGNSLQHIRGAIMLDLTLIAFCLALFAASVGYAYACDRL
jgi:hypothetical protein